VVTGYNKKKEMVKMFKEMDEEDDSQSMLSDIEIKEYWENIKRTAQAENKIISQMIDEIEDQDQKDKYQNNVIKLLHKEKE